MKKFTAIILTLLFITSTFSQVLAQSQLFRDVPTTHFAFEAITWASDPVNGAFMVGDAGNNFNPSRILTKFEGAQVFAMAAGFRHITPQVPPAEVDLLNRSFEMWQPFLDTISSTYSRWNRTFDREISFLLYKGILTINDVNDFITVSGGQETINQLTRQDAIAWTVRLIGRGSHAQAVTLPHHTPFRDSDQIRPSLSRYVYYAAEAGIIHGTGGYIGPLQGFTRAETAALLFQVLNDATTTVPDVGAAGINVATITGTVQSMVADTQINIASSAGVENFHFAQGSVVMVDNQERTPAFLQPGMAVTALINAQREILTIVARSQGDTVTPAQPTTPSGTVYFDEGIVTAVNENTVTISTRRIRLNGQVIDQARVFNFTDATTITAPDQNPSRSDLQVGSMVEFGFIGSNAHSITLLPGSTTESASINGRLIGISIFEYNPQITLRLENGAVATYAVTSGIFDMYTLRIGADLRVVIENRVATEIHLMRMP